MTIERALARTIRKKTPAASRPQEGGKEKPAHLLLGARGEEMAAEFLSAKGYEILERNVRFPWGELDIVAKQGSEIVFVEVRTRSIGKVLPADRSVGPNKLRKLVQSAQAWADSRHSRGCMRIDLVAIIIDWEKHVQIEHIDNITEAII